MKKDMIQKLQEAYGHFISVYTQAELSGESYIGTGQEALHLLAEEFKIGRITMELTAPPNPMESEGLKKKRIIYDADCPIENSPSEVYSYRSGEGGQVIYSFYSFPDHSFDEMTHQNLQTISELLFSYGGRARLGELVVKLLMNDHLTGISNLKGFLIHVQSLIQSCQISQFDAYILNIKNFKYVNKIVAHEKGSQCNGGDLVIRQYAQCLLTFCKEGENVARLGGDNFVALIRRERTEQFREFISDIELSIMTDSGERLISLGAVAGVYEIPDTIKEASEIMMPISVAFQAAKQILHKSYAYFSEELSQMILDGQKVLVDFSECLNKGEFVPYFQPKFFVEDDTLCGAEALARWKHKGEIIPPICFIPMLERDSTICRLDFEILGQTCDYIGKLLERGIKPVRISVNFSRWNLKNANLIKEVMQVLEQYHVPAQYIEVELTETVDAEEYATLTDVVAEFKKNGIATSIDDFGTGYSSLNLLKNLDVDVLKMDRSFIMEIGNKNEGHKDRVLISNIINMANALNMKVIAEGVETLEQKKFLEKCHCDMIQGFLYSKPLPLVEFDEMISKYSIDR